MNNIHFIKEGFFPNQINPITNEPFDEQWIFLEVVDTNKYELFSGGCDFVFRLSISKNNSEWPFRVMDFIEYELSKSKNILISMNMNDYRHAQSIFFGHTHKDNILREYERPVLVHSTTLESYTKILNSKKLKSWNLLLQEKSINEVEPIGKKLGDPDDYSDYIMFTNGGVTGEIIVNSKQLGYIEMNTNMQYRPGARFYFDAKKIAQDGKLIRDGAHLKVYESLDIDKYLLWIATLKNINYKGKTITPNIFSQKADRLFERVIGIKL